MIRAIVMVRLAASRCVLMADDAESPLVIPPVVGHHSSRRRHLLVR
jgi:hypothetical protein